MIPKFRAGQDRYAIRDGEVVSDRVIRITSVVDGQAKYTLVNHTGGELSMGNVIAGHAAGMKSGMPIGYGCCAAMNKEFYDPVLFIDPEDTLLSESVSFCPFCGVKSPPVVEYNLEELEEEYHGWIVFNDGLAAEKDGRTITVSEDSEESVYDILDEMEGE